MTPLLKHICLYLSPYFSHTKILTNKSPSLGKFAKPLMDIYGNAQLENLINLIYDSPSSHTYIILYTIIHTITQVNFKNIPKPSNKKKTFEVSRQLGPPLIFLFYSPSPFIRSFPGHHFPISTYLISSFYKLMTRMTRRIQ